MLLTEVMKELEQFGDEQTKKVLTKHGAKEPFFGVKAADYKKIQKKIKIDYQLALDLYDTGNSDAMYLAGLIADVDKMTIADFDKWVNAAYWYYLSEFAVAHAAAESKFSIELALKWMDSPKEQIASAGWATIACVLAIKPNDELDFELLTTLLDRIAKNIHEQPDRVRYTMNGFIIAVGTYIGELQDKAIETAHEVGKVSVNMGNTSCKVPDANQYIHKTIDKGILGKKRKTFRK